MSEHAVEPIGLLKRIDNEAMCWKVSEAAANENLSLIHCLYRRQFRFTRSLQRYDYEELVNRISDIDLRWHYENLIKKLNLRSNESERTFSERKFRMQINHFCKKRVMQSVWIGMQCIDFFIPNIRSSTNLKSTMRGLAIEIDGDVHNYESKMRKDEIKGNALAMLGIGHTSVPNWDVSHPAVRKFLGSLNSSRGLDSRERRRLWRRIYLITLAMHLSKTEFFSIFTKQVASDETTY